MSLRRLLCHLSFLLWVVLAPLDAAAETDWLLFPSLDLAYGDDFDREVFEDEAVPALDIFFSAHGTRWRVLGEAVVSSTEQEIERLQLGFEISEDTVAWLGRFHTPLSLWNQVYHHGEYLQTSITRPAAIDFEDDSGPLPSHLSGLLVEGTFGNQQKAWGYSVGIGAGPILAEEFVPFDFIDPSEVGALSAIGRLSYRKSGRNRWSFGGFAGAFDIEVRGRAFSKIQQRLAGVDLVVEAAQGRWLAALLGARNEWPTGGVSETFLSGYLQGERTFSGRWTGYARAEVTDADQRDRYFDLLPGFERGRILAGARLDLLPDHTVKLELVRSEGLDGTQFTTGRVQWSAAFSY